MRSSDRARRRSRSSLLKMLGTSFAPQPATPKPPRRGPKRERAAEGRDRETLSPSTTRAGQGDGQNRREVTTMKKLLLVMFLIALATPMFGRVLPGLGLATAYAQDDDDQGDDDQGEDNDEQ